MDLVDEEITSAVQQLLVYFHSESFRLQNNSKNSRSCLKANAEFDSLIGKLVNTPFGEIQSETMEEPELSSIECNSIVENNWLRPEASCERISPTLKSNSSNNGYENLRVISIKSNLRDKEKKRQIQRPCAVVTLPGTNYFAFLHNKDAISFLTSSGKIIASFVIDKEGKPSDMTPEVLLVDTTVPNRLICVLNAKLYTIEYTREFLMSDKSMKIEVKLRIADFKTPPFGAAFCHNFKRVLMTQGSYVVAYSTEDWSIKGSWQIPLSIVRKSQVFAVRDFALYFRADAGESLFAAPINKKTGEVEMCNVRKVDGGLAYLRSLTFDSKGNLILLDKARAVIKALTPEGNTLVKFVMPSKSAPFYFSDIALLESQDSTRPSRLMIVTDWLRHRLFLMET